MSEPQVDLQANHQVTLLDLERIVAGRAAADAGSSYTRTLLDKGVPKCAQKLGEEAVETVIAALSGSDSELVGETADLLYHLAVLLNARGIAFDAVHAELGRRTAQSGLQEKAARKHG